MGVIHAEGVVASLRSRLDDFWNWSPLRILEGLDDDLTERRILGRRYVVVRDPDLVEQVLVGGHQTYVKAVHYRLLAAVTGNGLLTSEGDEWKHQRRLIQPLLGRRELHRLGEHMVTAAEAGLDRWDSLADGETVDVAEAMTHLTLDVVGRALFGATLGDVADRLRPAVDTGLQTAVIAARLQLLLALPRRFVDATGRFVSRWPLLPPPLNRVQGAMRTIDGVVREIISARRAELDAYPPGTRESSDDMVGLLLSARGPDGSPMSTQQVRDELVTFMLAGHETTANGLAWTLLLLAQNPDAAAGVYAEVNEVVGDAPLTPAIAERLEWTTACFQEAMRLYPPAWILEREAEIDNMVGDHLIPAGTTVIIPVHAIHRDGRIWPEPARFKPERFIGEARYPRGAYLPFGAGRRMCVGANFALLEAAIILATIVRRYRLSISDDVEVVPEATVTLRPRGGLPMTVRPANPSWEGDQPDLQRPRWASP